MKKFIILLTTLSYCSALTVIDDKFKFRRWDSSPIRPWRTQKHLKRFGFDMKTILPPDMYEDAYLTVPQIIKKYGYLVEIHNVTTEDGYILQLHRITGSKKSPARKGKTPVLMVHGLLDSSYAYISLGPGNGLAYLLADLEYDVWLANTRGNRYSRQHVKLNPNHRNFWNFTFNELGTYDLPAMIDYIIKVTDQNKLHYVGHSQGTASFFAMGSERPEYNSKILTMNALAPVSYMTHMPSPILRLIIPALEKLDKATSYFGLLEFLPNKDIISTISNSLCRDEKIVRTVCTNLLFLIIGFNPSQFNISALPVFLAHTPAGASQKQIVHFAQMVRTFRFQKYDYGIFTNLKRYGNFLPPEYDLTKVTAPVALYYGLNDYLTSPIDVRRLKNKLPNVIEFYEVPDKDFNHLDFEFAIDAKKLLYDRVIEVMKLRENEV